MDGYDLEYTYEQWLERQDDEYTYLTWMQQETMDTADLDEAAQSEQEA